jgi:hypothetical protein
LLFLAAEVVVVLPPHLKLLQVTSQRKTTPFSIASGTREDSDAVVWRRCFRPAAMRPGSSPPTCVEDGRVATVQFGATPPFISSALFTERTLLIMVRLGWTTRESCVRR